MARSRDNRLCDPRQDQILEVGYVVSDLKLEPLSTKGSFALHPTPHGMERMRRIPEIYEMHTNSDLISYALNHGESSLLYVENEMLAQLADHWQPGELMLAGSGVAHFDRKFIEAQMPGLAAHLHYGLFDIGVLRRALRIMIPGFKSPTLPASSGDTKKHRALDDAVAHLQEAQLIRDALRRLEADANWSVNHSCGPRDALDMS